MKEYLIFFLAMTWSVVGGTNQRCPPYHNEAWSQFSEANRTNSHIYFLLEMKDSTDVWKWCDAIFQSGVWQPAAGSECILDATASLEISPTSGSHFIHPFHLFYYSFYFSHS